MLKKIFNYIPYYNLDYYNLQYKSVTNVSEPAKITVD